MSVTLDKRKAIDILAREIASLFGHIEWDTATDFQRRTWRAEATAIWLKVQKGSKT